MISTRKIGVGDGDRRLEYALYRDPGESPFDAAVCHAHSRKAAALVGFGYFHHAPLKANVIFAYLGVGNFGAAARNQRRFALLVLDRKTVFLFVIGNDGDRLHALAEKLPYLHVGFVDHRACFLS